MKLRSTSHCLRHMSVTAAALLFGIFSVSLDEALSIPWQAPYCVDQAYSCSPWPYCPYPYPSWVQPPCYSGWVPAAPVPYARSPSYWSSPPWDPRSLGVSSWELGAPGAARCSRSPRGQSRPNMTLRPAPVTAQSSGPVPPSWLRDQSIARPIGEVVLSNGIRVSVRQYQLILEHYFQKGWRDATLADGRRIKSSSYEEFEEKMRGYAGVLDVQLSANVAVPARIYCCVVRSVGDDPDAFLEIPGGSTCRLSDLASKPEFSPWLHAMRPPTLSAPAAPAGPAAPVIPDTSAAPNAPTTPGPHHGRPSTPMLDSSTPVVNADAAATAHPLAALRPGKSHEDQNSKPTQPSLPVKSPGSEKKTSQERVNSDR